MEAWLDPPGAGVAAWPVLVALRLVRARRVMMSSSLPEPASPGVSGLLCPGAASPYLAAVRRGAGVAGAAEPGRGLTAPWPDEEEPIRPRPRLLPSAPVVA